MSRAEVMDTGNAWLEEEAEGCYTSAQGPIWFRRGSGSGSGHVEDSSPRESNEKTINANDERFALAA